MNKEMITLNRRILSYAVILLFFSVLWLPLLQMAFSFLPEINLTENRFLAAKPDIRKFTIHKPVFQKELEKYFSDNFGCRSLLIYLNNYLRVMHLNVSPNPNIAIGKQGWLYYDDARNNDTPFRDYMGLAWYKEIQLNKILTNLNAVNRELTKRGMTFLLVIAPNKQTIYPEYLPDSIKKYRLMTKADQLMEHLHTHLPELHAVDLRSALLKAKESAKHPLYSKTDSHWNAYGGYIASLEIVRTLLQRHSQMKPLAIPDPKIQESNRQGGDIAAMLSMSQVMEDTEVSLSWENIPSPLPFNPVYVAERGKESAGFIISNSKLPKLLMLQDSFGSALIPSLSWCFSRSVFLWTHSIDRTVVEQEKPDIIILEIVERNLDRLLGDDLYK